MTWKSFWSKVEKMFFYNLRDCMGAQLRNRWKILSGGSILALMSKPIYVIYGMLFANNIAGSVQDIEYLPVVVIGGFILGILMALMMVISALALYLLVMGFYNGFKNKATW